MHASEAVGELVDALIGCRFEETQEGHDEAVRARIMQVLVGYLEGGAGTWLPDEVVWEVLQTCMANLDQMVSASDLWLLALFRDSLLAVMRYRRQETTVEVIRHAPCTCGQRSNVTFQEPLCPLLS